MSILLTYANESIQGWLRQQLQRSCWWKNVLTAEYVDYFVRISVEGCLDEIYQFSLVTRQSVLDISLNTHKQYPAVSDWQSLTKRDFNK